jgi:glucose uptake protein GlcU
LNAGETTLGLEDVAPQLIVLAILELLLGRRLNISMLINGIILTAFDRISKNFGGFLNALKEAIILRVASSSLLVRVVTKDLLSVSTLDLFLGSSESVL